MRFALGLTALSTLLFTSACDGTHLTQKEAETVYGGQNKVVGDVFRSFYDAAQNATVPDGITLTGDITNGTVSGTLDGGPDFDGSVSVDGDIAVASDNYTFGFSTDYSAVNVDNISLDGSDTLSSDASVDTNAGAFTFDFSTAASLDVTGDAKGHGDLNYSVGVDVNISTGTYSLTSTGDINGYSTTSMSIADVAAWVASLYL